MSHSHVPERELALFAVDPDQVPEGRRREIEEDVAACAECQESYDFFRIGEDDLLALGEADTWEPALQTATYESLMALGARVAREDEEAEVLLKDFIANPMATAWTSLAARRAFRTGGVVRKLNAAAHANYETNPLAALTFADAAISIADVLPDDLYPAKGVYQLRGTAWKERANAQLMLGRFPEAHESLDRAERAYRKTPHNTLGLSIVALIRAGVMYEQGRLDEATGLAERAEHGFAHAADEKRRMDAVFLRGGIMVEAGRPRFAVGLFEQVIEYGENSERPVVFARGSYALAHCYVDLGKLDDAALHFHKALAVFRGTGQLRDRMLAEWGIARIVLVSGKYSEAIRRLKQVAAEFEANTMVTNAALVGLDIADALLATGRSNEIVALAQHVFDVFRGAGMLTGALSAIAYLKEAAVSGTLTSAMLNEVRSFLKRAQRQHDLQFVPAPRPQDSV